MQTSGPLQLILQLGVPCCLELYSEILYTEYNSVLLETENEVATVY